MVVAQKLKESEITEQDSLLLTRNLLRIAMFNISYIRGLFPEKYFNDKSVPALDMKIKKLMPMDAESRRLIDWMEKGVYDALQKKYLRTLLFCICEATEGPMIEEYSFSFSYSNSDSQEVLMNINRNGSKRQGGTFKCSDTNEVTPSQMRSSACKMVRTLVQLMRTLDKMPEERTILMKLLYYDNVTPDDYEPPFFKSYTAEAHNQWTKTPLKMEVGNVNNKHFVLALKVKSVLDPCEHDSDEYQDDVSLGVDSVQKEDSSETGSEVGSSQEDQYIVAAADIQQPCVEDNMSEKDDTQDPAEDEKQLTLVKDWISSCHLETVEITDALSHFPNISEVLIEGKWCAFSMLYKGEIMEKLVQESILSKISRDTYAIQKQKKFDFEFGVKEETIDQVPPIGDKTSWGIGEDNVYMKALYHVLKMEYVTVAKLQSKLEGKVNQTTVRKLIDKMTRDGFVEAQSNRRLGKRVIHSVLTEKKLSEVRKALDTDAMETDISGPRNNWNLVEFQGIDIDPSTYGTLHSVGSELTRTRSKSETHQNGPVRSGQTVQERDLPYTPLSNALPVASRESIVSAKDDIRINRNNIDCNDMDNIIFSKSTQDKRSRKASMVKEPILQYLKRQKSQAL